MLMRWRISASNSSVKLPQSQEHTLHREFADASLFEWINSAEFRRSFWLIYVTRNGDGTQAHSQNAVTRDLPCRCVDCETCRAARALHSERIKRQLLTLFDTDLQDVTA